MTLVEFLNERLKEQDADGHSLNYLQTGEFLLADAAAKRTIVALHSGENDEPCQSGNYVYEPCATLKALASAYADHPDYQQEWSA